MKNDELTNREMLGILQQDTAAIMHAVEHHAVATERRFDMMTEMIQGLASHLDQEIRAVRSEMATKEDLKAFATKDDLTSLVTKEYFDEKLLDLRSDLIVMARKSNKKLEILIEELVAEKRLHPLAARKILLLEPFPQT